jgi:hypothetical protein
MAQTTTQQKGGQIYTIHSLPEAQVDTRVRRLAALNEKEARDLTTQIQRTTARLWLLVTEAHDRKAHLALGYETWADYVKAELRMSESRSYQFLDTGHVMKALASAGVNVEDVAPPPTRVIARVKDRLTDVKKAATEALKSEGGDPIEAVDKAIRALAREPRKPNGNGEPAPEPEGNGDEYQGADAGEASPREDTKTVPCPACAGSGKVTQTVADRLLKMIKAATDRDRGGGRGRRRST